MLALLALSLASVIGAQPSPATRLRVEYIDAPLTIDVKTPRFSWALVHSSRAQYQTSYHLIVTQVGGATVWDSGVVTSNTTLNVPYGGSQLPSNTDFTWSLVWTDAQGATAGTATSTFSTALYTPTDWKNAEFVSSQQNGSLNTYRAEFTLSAAPVRARLFMHGLGYAKTWINGALTDDHELGTFTTFQQRTLYDVVDVTSLVHAGCNAVGVMIGHGWFSQPKVHAGPRQFRLLLSLTDSTGAITYLASANAAGAPGALVFSAIAGPVLADDIYLGETYDGRVMASIDGFAACGFTPSAAWVPTVPPFESPLTFGSVISSHAVHIRTDRSYSVVDSGITQPKPNVFVFDFGQNMAGQSTLKVEDCPVGTNITLIHNEILNPDGTVNRNLAPMVGTYFCAGNGGVEVYRTMFTYYGFRYVEVIGFPGVPGEETVSAHFVHSDVPQSGEFTSSSPLLNAIQHATRFASWSNLMDVPTDCPQRERFGWLGDAQLSFETVIHNIDGGGFYTKWLSDFADTQVFDNITYQTDGALPDCIPYYGHGHESADAGWGFAAWSITDSFSDFYADDVFDVAWYPNLKWYMTNWVTAASSTPSGLFPITFWGDWANYVPGPYAFHTAEYPQFFYIRALEITAKFAARLGHADDAAYYSNLALAARDLYVQHFYNSSTGCFANCTYVSQFFGLTLGLAGPQGSPSEAAAWANVMDWFSANATKGVPEHFGGGIISLKYSLPLFDAHGETGLALKMHLQTDQAPGFGYWVEVGDATTLWEAYDMTATEGTASRNHIMFGAAGSWYYSSLAGLSRAPDSRSWQKLLITPPSADDVIEQLSFASASIDSPMGLVSSAWAASTVPNAGDVCGASVENTVLTLECVGGQFSSVAFASYGTPSGSCYGDVPPSVNSTCNAPDSVAVVEKLCVGKSKCVIDVNTTTFGGTDPCFKTHKSLTTALVGSCVSVVFSVDAAVPVGARALIRVPSRGVAPSSIVITEGGQKVWANGAFVPGVAGISGAAVTADGIQFDCGSGSFSFELIK